MNKSESKYFATAAKMDNAFLELIENKDFAYITVKEICKKAGVNRSTFYLHYENMGDLLSECSRYINERFLNYMDKDSDLFIKKLKSCPTEELYLITPEYLRPYLNFIKENQRLFKTVVMNADVFDLKKSYADLLARVVTPILNRYGVPENNRSYIMSFHISGLMAIITEWLKENCSDSVEHIISVIQLCIKQNTSY